MATQQDWGIFGHFCDLDNIHVFMCIWMWLKNGLAFALILHNHRMHSCDVGLLLYCLCSTWEHLPSLECQVNSRIHSGRADSTRTIPICHWLLLFWQLRQIWMPVKSVANPYEHIFLKHILNLTISQTSHCYNPHPTSLTTWDSTSHGSPYPLTFYYHLSAEVVSSSMNQII